MADNDVFDSVQWDSESHSPPTMVDYPISSGSASAGYNVAQGDGDPAAVKWEGYIIPLVSDPIKELEGTKDMYVSYRVSAKTDLPTFSTPNPSTRRRFQDFTFLREHLAKDFPACVIPPLPNKHRLEYVTGDRFSPEFIERRKVDLQRFMDRVARHPTLQCSTLLHAFLTSTEWNVQMHSHLAHPPGPEGPPTLLENVTDTLMNAFSRVRKPDERFLEVRDHVDKFEEGLAASERGWMRVNNKTNDLSTDYHDFAVSVQGLGFLESGITEPLNRYSNTLLEFSALLKHNSEQTTEPFLHTLHALLSYNQANRSVLRLRDQKQLDLEELSEYLSQKTLERDRLAAQLGGGQIGPSGFGLSSYIRDRVDAIRGNVVDERTRVEKMKRLDVEIKKLQKEVTEAHETADAFNAETFKEQIIFEHAKSAEMKDLLSDLADGQIKMYRQAMEEWDKIIPVMQRIRVDV
ncbi:intercellular trafficking and secretion [Tulasnella sp. JGI-2019a]|nr:intercellular trafficking and secretion [Tulasnella sp. JGI-2019a]